MSEILCGLSPKFGSFAVLGNHEYYGGQVEQAVRHLQQGGIRVLRDETVKVADSFYIVGRDYRGAGRFTGQQRKELQVIMKGIDGSLPIILLDHEPVCLEEAKQAGVDLQLSGHTHKGQFFPNQLVTGMMFDIDWGYLRRENLQVIVSSGFGTWGPPIRIGNRPEIVDIMIHFDKN